MHDLLREFVAERAGAGDEANLRPLLIGEFFEAGRPHERHRVDQDAMALARNQSPDRAHRDLVR